MAANEQNKGIGPLTKLLAGAGAGYLVVLLVKDFTPPGGPYDLVDFVVAFGLYLAWKQVSILLHELGHALMGKWRGMHFCTLVFGRFQFANTKEGLRIGKSLRPRGLGGYTLSYAYPGRPTRMDQGLYIFGGPLTNLLGCAALLPVVRGQLDWDASPLLAWSLVCFGGLSAMYWVLFLVQYFWGKNNGSDGQRLRRILTNHPNWAFDASSITLLGLLQSTTRPRDLPQDLLDHLGESVDPDHSSYHAWLRALASYDNGDPEQALIHARTAYDRLEVDHRRVKPLFAGLVAQFTAESGGSPQEAREWFAEYQSPLLEEHRRMEVEASILLAEGKPQNAIEVLNEAERGWANAIFPITDYDRDWHADLLRRCRAALPAVADLAPNA